jgi:hypothetical protein
LSTGNTLTDVRLKQFTGNESSAGNGDKKESPSEKTNEGNDKTETGKEDDKAKTEPTDKNIIERRESDIPPQKNLEIRPRENLDEVTEKVQEINHEDPGRNNSDVPTGISLRTLAC